MLAAVNRKLVGVSPFSRVSPFSIPRFIPTPIFPLILPRSFPHRTGRGRPHRYAGEVRCEEKRGLLVRGSGAEKRYSPGTGSGPAHPQRRDRFHPHQAPATGRGRGDQTGPRLCAVAVLPSRVTRLRTRSQRKEPWRVLLCAAPLKLHRVAGSARPRPSFPIRRSAALEIPTFACLKPD